METEMPSPRLTLPDYVKDALKKIDETRESLKKSEDGMKSLQTLMESVIELENNHTTREYARYLQVTPKHVTGLMILAIQGKMEGAKQEANALYLQLEKLLKTDY